MVNVMIDYSKLSPKHKFWYIIGEIVAIPICFIIDIVETIDEFFVNLPERLGIKERE